MWLPIETFEARPGVAAKPVLLFCPEMTTWARYENASSIVVGAWDGEIWESDVGEIEAGYEGEVCDRFVREALAPTHWMPLPATPPALPRRSRPAAAMFDWRV